MGGGLMELVAYGAQDIYLTGNPQITFFKVVYRRHTNFSMESIQQTWLGTELTANSGVAGKCEAIISRNGDLISRMYLELNVTNSSSVPYDVDSVDQQYKFNVTTALLENVELQIGGQRIDKQSGVWMEAWAELTEPNPDGTSKSYADETSGTLFQKMSGFGGCTYDNTGSGEIFKANLNPKFFVPLFFWFCRNPGLSLPLIALQYHEVKVILNHRYNSGHHQFDSNKLWCDYIYLDTDERRRFAQVSHEYLIEQVQETNFGSYTTITNQNLNFNHPVKELIFVRYGDGISANSEGGFQPIRGTGSPTLKLVLNGSDRFKERDYRYFTKTQVNQHHTGNAILANADVNTSSVGNIQDLIGVYSFALKPEEHQPSGTCNFSRIDSAKLVATDTIKLSHIFAVNYNVLRIMSGMGGLAYSN